MFYRMAGRDVSCPEGNGKNYDNESFDVEHPLAPSSVIEAHAGCNLGKSAH